jgi:hypothetical protein
MLSWIIQVTIISTILIFLVHHLINFFKSTLTVPKIKDLVNNPTKNYENIYNIINNREKNQNPDDYYIDSSSSNNNNNNNNDTNYTLIDLLPKNDNINMKDELKNFLKSQLHN